MRRPPKRRNPVRAACLLNQIIVDANGPELAMAPEDECQHEMFVRVHWQDRLVKVPLVQLAGRRVDPPTRQAIEDWHYWRASGYEL